MSIRKFILLSIFFLVCAIGLAQPKKYSVANAHSHNDYENPDPFWAAYNHGFGSIEADIFLVNDELIVAHDRKELELHRTLEKFYLQPLLKSLQLHNGHIYADSARSLQMLIDVKTEGIATLQKLVETLRQYPLLIQSPSIKWAISGNRPPENSFSTYPAFIGFDGILSKNYEGASLARIILFSDDFKQYSSWNGEGEMNADDEKKLTEAINRSHALQLPVRFWNAPDQTNAWRKLIGLGVDYINTDHIPALAAFLK